MADDRLRDEAVRSILAPLITIDYVDVDRAVARERAVERRAHDLAARPKTNVHADLFYKRSNQCAPNFAASAKYANVCRLERTQTILVSSPRRLTEVK